MKMENEIRNIFRKQISNLSKARRGVEEGPKTEEVTGFVLSHFWLHYTLGVNSLSNGVTKLAVLLTEPPLPDVSTVKSCVMEIEASYKGMVNAYLSLPKSEGTQFCKVIGNATQAILFPLHSYFVKIHRETSDPTQAEVVGVIWRSCEVVSELPKDNRAAVGKLIDTERGLIRDALEELKQELKAGRVALKSLVSKADEGSTWSKGELTLVEAGAELVALVEGTLTSASSSLSPPPTPAPPPPLPSLDLLASAASLLSPALDDFISSLYPPIDLDPIDRQVDQVVGTMRTILDLLSGRGGDESWRRGLAARLDESQSRLHSLVASNQIMAVDSLKIN